MSRCTRSLSITQMILFGMALHAGAQTTASPSGTQTLVIGGAQTGGAACHQTCTLEPPGHRGLHSKPKNGSMGGTQGLQAPQPTPQP